MLKGMEHIHRINELMKEMQVEFSHLREAELEHRSESPIVQNMLIDLEHLPENISMNGSESAIFISKMRNCLQKRDNLNEFFGILNTLGQEFVFLDTTIQSILPRVNHLIENQSADFYRFRTDEMYEFISSFKDIEKRAQKEYRPRKAGTVIPAPAESNNECKAKEDVSTPPKVNTVVQPIVSKATVHPYRIQGAGKQWQVYCDGEYLISTKNVNELVNFLIDEKPEVLKIQGSEKKQLLSHITRLKMKSKGKTLYFMEGIREIENRILSAS